MKKETGKRMCVASSLLAAFVLWTLAVCVVDVQTIGPKGSAIGFAGLNGWVHELTGVHMDLYVITDWLSLVPLLLVLGFGVLGLCQWITRKSLAKVDRSILLLGGFYLVVMAVYFLFEICVINNRPVLIEGVLEASYPSSTTVLVMCVMLTALLQLRQRIRKAKCRCLITIVMTGFTVFMVMGRFLSGVHWFTDIVGGMLLSAGLVWMYRAVSKI